MVAGSKERVNTDICSDIARTGALGHGSRCQVRRQTTVSVSRTSPARSIAGFIFTPLKCEK
jgi:hypothetical protein